MNVLLGARIRSLRESKGLTQEQFAEKMKCTRQKYARLEKGLIDVSYSSLITVAQMLEVKLEEITSVVSDCVQDQPMFRAGNSVANNEKFVQINKMLDIFYAHRKLYYSVRQTEANE